MSLASHRPVQDTTGVREIEVKHRRSKRNVFRFILALLKAVRPVSRIGGKLTKHGRFWKTIKYTSYAVGAGTFTYEIANIAGWIPDVQYSAIVAEIDSLHSARIQDLSYLKNLTLATTQLSDVVTDLYMEVTDLLSNAKTSFDIQLQGSILLSSYLTSIQSSLAMLAAKKIPTTVMSLDMQRSWLEKKLPSALLNSIGSISPHLPIALENIDVEKNLILVRVDVPKVDNVSNS